MADSDFEASLAAARSGDEDAFASIWRALNPALVRYLRVLEPDAADDVASEAWLQVVRGLRRFRGDEAGFKSWLFTIARNKVTDARRRRQRRPTVPLDPGQALTETIADDDTERAVLDRIGTDDALRLIATTLPPEQAVIFMLRVVAGMDVADVARVLRKSPGAVRVASHRALARLRDALHQPGESHESARGAVTR
jgi:RNA polymerase sigma-70 factor (ECF subfamily)